MKKILLDEIFIVCPDCKKKRKLLEHKFTYEEMEENFKQANIYAGRNNFKLAINSDGRVVFVERQ
jgi:uncharacterized protein YbaR (Trm112 family)